MNMTIRTETVKTGDFETDFFRFGRGKRTMVIIPGLSVQRVMLSADAVAREYSVMEDEFTVFVFDRRRPLPADCSISALARGSAAAFDALGLRDICLFGASQGGMISLEIAASRPDLVKKLAVASTSVNVTEKNAKAVGEWIEKAARGDGEGLYLAFGGALYPPGLFAMFRDALAEAGRAATGEELERFAVLANAARGFDFRDRAGEIRCPLFAAGSSDDMVLGGGAIEEIAGVFREKTDFVYHVYKGYGHAAYDTAPDFRDRLYDFFTRR